MIGQYAKPYGFSLDETNAFSLEQITARPKPGCVAKAFGCEARQYDHGELPGCARNQTTSEAGDEMTGGRKMTLGLLALTALTVLVAFDKVPDAAFVPGLWAILGTVVSGNVGEHFARRGHNGLD